MKMLVIYMLLLTAIVSLKACKKDKSDCSTPASTPAYEAAIYEFQLVDKGDQTKGYCGPVIRAFLDSSKRTMVYFKAIDLPAGISFNANIFYKGQFRVLPEKYTCMDGIGDPLPGQSSPEISPNFVVILKWELK